jgi:flagellar basal body-associated protein FliL
VSESGFAIGDETQQLIIRLFSELKMDIRAVATGQDDLKEELRNDIENSISAVTGEISAVYDGQEELKNDMKSEISAIKKELRQKSVTFRRE